MSLTGCTRLMSTAATCLMVHKRELHFGVVDRVETLGRFLCAVTGAGLGQLGF